MKAIEPVTTLEQLDKPSYIGRYRVESTLGRGGMGVVYKAFDPIIERVVAIKLLRRVMSLDQDEYQSYLKTFYLEAKAAGRLNHPNIVMIHDVGEWEHLPYIVMEYLEGTNLHKLVAKKFKMPWEEAARIIRETGNALAYAHSHGVIHRDIKPSNIAILRDGKVKVLDFGVARITEHETPREEDIIGTPSYLAPEVLHGTPARPESDIFSLGVVFYQIVTGEKPFQGDNIAAILSSILNTKPHPPTHLNPSLPPIFDTIILRMLAKSPKDRYRNATAVVDDLGRLIDHGHTIELDIPEDSDLFAEETQALDDKEPTLREISTAPTAWLKETWKQFSLRKRILIISSAVMVLTLCVSILIPALRSRTPKHPIATITEPSSTTPPSLSPSPPPKTQPDTLQIPSREERNRFFQLGKNYCLNRIYTKCAQLMEKVLELDPNDAEAKKWLETARQHLGQSSP